MILRFESFNPSELRELPAVVQELVRYPNTHEGVHTRISRSQRGWVQRHTTLAKIATARRSHDCRRRHVRNVIDGWRLLSF